MIKQRCTMVAAGLVLSAVSICSAQSLWELAQQNKELLTISTLFTAQNVRDYLSDAGTNDAIDWCKKTGVTHVFIESFRDNYSAERSVLEQARDRFRQAGFDVSGCITTTRMGKKSTGWDLISCYTNEGTQKQLQAVFEYAASIFDEIMIDDFLFTDCQCSECIAARGDQSWTDYRCDLMTRLSREKILAPARQVNPDVKIIIKYPQWYDRFHERGYEVVIQTNDYDRIWVGTETRDFDNPRWGGKVQYEAYFIMRWLGGIGGPKTGGGWFDPYGTTEDTYVEQARQTILADAKEMLLFCYGSLQRDTGPANVLKLRAETSELFELAKFVRGQPIQGIAAPKIPNSDAGREPYVYDFVGMLGLPLVPSAEIDPAAQAIFLPAHSLKDPQLKTKLRSMKAAGTPVLVTDDLARQLTGIELDAENMVTLNVGGDPKNLLKLTQEQLRPIRKTMLRPFGLDFDAPNKVALYLIGEDRIVVENFNDEIVDITLVFAKAGSARRRLVLPKEGGVKVTSRNEKVLFAELTPRTLVAIEYE